MRTTLCLACLCLWMACNTIAAQLPRVGDTIDVAERNYFQLFPTISDFSEAVISTDESGNRIEITSRNVRQNVNIRLDQIKRAEFEHYLRDFEAIEFGKQKVNRELLSDFIWYKQPTRHRGAFVDLEKTNGEKMRARIFHVADSALVLVYPHIAPDWNDAKTFASIPADEIRQISQPELNKIGGGSIGFIFGAVIGGAVAGNDPVTGQDEFWGPATKLVLGLVCGIGGALVGLGVSSLQPGQRYDIHGSRSAFSEYHDQLVARARSPYLPPELINRTPGKKD